jgi:hypothetical protein
MEQTPQQVEQQRQTAIEDGITVTTATQTPEQVRANFGIEPPAEEKPPVAAVAAVAEPTAEAELEAELDKQEPPKADETPDQRTARRSRATKQILKQISLRKAAEERATKAETENATLRQAAKAATPPTLGDGTKKPDDATAAAIPAAPEFTFPTWEEWSTKNPDAEYHQYTDARTDARYAFNDHQRQAEETRTRDTAKRKEGFDALKAHEAAFTTDHPDYDDVIATISIAGVDPSLIVDLQALLVKSGVAAPGINYFLGKNPDEAQRLLRSANRAAMTETFGEIKYAAKAQSVAQPAAEPAAAAPVRPAAKPATNAPAPVSETRGAATSTRTTQQLAEDDDDADAYIAARTRELRAAG